MNYFFSALNYQRFGLVTNHGTLVRQFCVLHNKRRLKMLDIKNEELALTQIMNSTDHYPEKN